MGTGRILEARVRDLALDTGHFTSARYTDAALAEAVRQSTTLREVALRLGAVPASGTLSHLSRRIASAGIDVSHFPSTKRVSTPLPFSPEQLAAAAASAVSLPDLVRSLGLPDDVRSRQALGRRLREQGVDTSHFRNARLALSDGAVRDAVARSTGYAAVIRALGLPETETNRRRVRRAVANLGLDTSHFTRRAWGRPEPSPRPASADSVLVLLHTGAPRTSRARLHQALQEVGVPYRCAGCGSDGTWRGRPLTLQIDHVNGNWQDNRRENLRYLCPNCHAQTDTWCRNRKPRKLVQGQSGPVD